MAGCLDGMRVLDLGRYQAGPRCGLMLHDLGAEVIKVEKPGGEEGRENGPFVNGWSVYWAQYNRGKKSITLNMRDERAKDILKGLVKISDVLIQNFRPGVIADMGFGYDVLKKLNPKIIMTNVSAYGQFGPYRERPGFDGIGQAISGHMDLTGFPENPPTRAYFSIIDRITSLHATIGTLAALREAEHSGEGQCVDVCLADSGFTLTEIPISTYLATGKFSSRRGNRGQSESAPNNTYMCSDGWIYITAGSRDMWRRVCRLIGKAEWIDDPRFQSRTSKVDHADMIDEAVSEWLGKHTMDEAVKIMSEAGIPIAPCNDVPRAAKDPHLWERRMLMPVKNPDGGKDIYAAGEIIKLSRTPTIQGELSRPGQFNEEIMCGLLGMSKQTIEQYKAEGAI